MPAERSSEPASIFLPDFKNMSREELLAYIARTRRQLERFDRLPEGAASPIDPAEAEALRQVCDELEASLTACR